jgi:hypothetical protein
MDHRSPFTSWVAAAIVVLISTWNAISTWLGSSGAVVNDSLAESVPCCDIKALCTCVHKVFRIGASMGAVLPACNCLAIYADRHGRSGHAGGGGFSFHSVGGGCCGGGVSSRGVIGDGMM